jgi:hypothetical protein
MPNGIDKNWYRMCAAINGFRARYGSWPTIIRLPEGAIEYLFAEGSFASLQEKLMLVYDGSTYIAEDDLGRRYNLGQEGFSDVPPDIQVHQWLNIEPNSEMVKEYYAPSSNDTKDGKVEDRRRIGCLGVLISELVLLTIVIVVLLVSAAMDYDGTCISWEPPIPSCSMGEYMRQVALLMPVGLIVQGIRYWWIAVPLIILFPILGNAILALMDRKGKKIATGQQE